MTDIILSSQFSKSFPTIATGLDKAQKIFNSIESFEDIERLFLKGAGLSPTTYTSYKKAYKYFYDYTDSKHILQVGPGDIEAWYDTMIERGIDRNTAKARISGIKKVFEGVRIHIPFYTSPFETMSEKLKKKLGRTKKGNRTKAALSKTELKTILAWLEQDGSIKGLENYAITYMLVTSGLRASELLQLKWKDLLFDPETSTWKCFFIGKGGKEAEQELYPQAVGACLNYFTQAFMKEPKPDDNLFWTVPSFPGDTPRLLNYPTLWTRFKDLGKKIITDHVIKRTLIITPHTLRRTYATLLNKAGMGLKAIQLKTRHASIETLTRHYIDDSEPAGPYLQKILT